MQPVWGPDDVVALVVADLGVVAPGVRLDEFLDDGAKLFCSLFVGEAFGVRAGGAEEATTTAAAAAATAAATAAAGTSA